jgi:hypothetical protein
MGAEPGRVMRLAKLQRTGQTCPSTERVTSSRLLKSFSTITVERDCVHCVPFSKEAPQIMREVCMNTHGRLPALLAPADPMSAGSNVADGSRGPAFASAATTACTAGDV